MAHDITSLESAVDVDFARCFRVGRDVAADEEVGWSVGAEVLGIGVEGSMVVVVAGLVVVVVVIVVVAVVKVVLVVVVVVVAIKDQKHSIDMGKVSLSTYSKTYSHILRI